MKPQSFNRKKVLVAMSGGVDSSMTAALLVRQGYFVVGGYMKNFSPESWEGVLDSDCPWEKDLQDVQAVCEKLQIEFRSFNFEKEYREKVIEYFFNEYAAGRTPNPDVMCNKEIKFGLFLEKALELGFDYIATGHYVRSRTLLPWRGEEAPTRVGAGEVEFELLKGLDPKKDQSYFLYTLTQAQLKYILFPIGDYTKPQVRAMAKEFGLPNWNKKDSQGICFVGHIKLREFLRQRLPERVGEIVDSTGQVIGRHRGAWYYTIGQRRGLRIGGTGPYYVAEKNVVNNQLIVEPTVARRFIGSITVRDIHWINLLTPSLLKRGKGEFSCQAKIRYQQHDQPCQVFSPSRRKDLPKGGREGGEEEGVRVVFERPQFAPAPGQSIVFYDDDKVLGGGTIK